MIKSTKINSVKVNPVVTSNKFDKTNVKGFALFPQPIWTTFICARKKSGKTSLINLITQKCIDKRTTIWLFVSTYKIDPTWIHIIKTLRDKGNTVNCYDSIIEGKQNILQEIVDGLADDDDDEPPIVESKKEPEKTGPKIQFGGQAKIAEPPKPKPIKEYKPKKQACENLFILDDISQQLKNPSVSALLKVHRHTKSSVIISSQYLHDLAPQAILQLDYFICFNSFSKEKLEIIHKLLDLSIPFDRFLAVYKHCTEIKYNFMYLSIRDEQIRCCFNEKIEFDE